MQSEAVNEPVVIRKLDALVIPGDGRVGRRRQQKRWKEMGVFGFIFDRESCYPALIYHSDKDRASDGSMREREGVPRVSVQLHPFPQRENFVHGQTG